MNRQQRRRAGIEERATTTDREGAALKNAVMNLFPSTGNVRFICECGSKFTDGGVAIEHTFEGHEVVRERFSIGMWHFVDTLNGRSVAEMIWNRLREDGEDPERFLDRIKGYVAKKDEEFAALEAAEREMGIR